MSVTLLFLRLLQLVIVSGIRRDLGALRHQYGFRLCMAQAQPLALSNWYRQGLARDPAIELLPVNRQVPVKVSLAPPPTWSAAAGSNEHWESLQPCTKQNGTWIAKTRHLEQIFRLLDFYFQKFRLLMPNRHDTPNSWMQILECLGPWVSTYYRLDMDGV